MNTIRGEVGIEIAGEQRTLVFDMQAAEALYQALGAHYLLWLYERFLGKPDKLADGTKIRRMEPASPRELIIVTHGMLATDRLKNGRTEAVEDLFRSFPPFELQELHLKLSKVVMASIGVPGEAVEAGLGAAAEPPGSAPAATPGTGEQP